MSALAKLGIRPSGWFALRTPTLSYDEFLAWGRGVEGEIDVLRERLRRAVARPEVRDAVFVASPRVAELLGGWLDGSTEGGPKVENAVVRYFTRMTGRATPFGLFAGTSCGRLAAETTLELSPLHSYRRRTRLDMEYLSGLVSELERDPELRARLEFRPNSSVYSGAGRLRYAEARTGPGGRVHHLVAVEGDGYLDATLERASGGARPDDLATALVDDDVTLDEARAYVAELIDTQILVSDLAPPVTGPEPLEVIVATLARHRAGDGAAATLTRARDVLGAIDARGIGADRDDYLAVAESLRGLPAPVELNRLFQVDLTKPAGRMSLGPRVVEEVARGLEVLHRLSPPPDRDNPLSRFRRAFTDRFGDAEVPLVEALDEEIGIGFEVSSTPAAEASPLLEGLTFEPARDETARWGRRDQWLLTRVVEASRANDVEIALSPQDVDDIASDPRPLPEAFSVMATLGARSAADVDKGDFRLLLGGFYGPSGGRLIGRFCHSDPEQHRFLQEHLRQEEALHPDAVYAEIVHLPEGRLGNILLRPVLRDYEIPYLGRSGAPEERQIPVQDLYVAVRDDRILLRSARLGKEVRPRLTTAHNYSWRSLGVYRFLCALQAQGTAGGVAWDWGVLDGSPFLPRVSVGKTILSRATWLVTQKDLTNLRDDDSGAWAAWREARSIPRFAALVEADHELIVDWHNALSVRSFLALVRRRPWARLVEVWPDPDELVVRGPEGRFRHEIVLPFVRTEPVAAPAATAAPERDVRRSFPPGTEWLYLKLYTGTATADVVLRDHVGPLVRKMVADGLADSWFFIRYGDPHWHLRLRIHGDPAALTGEVLPRLQERASRLLEDGMAWNVQLDTYVREVDRYGGAEAIEVAERLFGADSEAALAIVESLAGDEGMDARWRLTLQSVHRVLDDFGFALDERSRIVRALRDSYAAEFGSSSDLKRRIGRRYREEKGALEALLGEVPAPRFAAEAFAARTAQVRPLVAQLRALDERRRLSRSLDDVASSLVHMTANRLLRSAARAQEMVIYDLLDRLYLARAKRGVAPRR